jgi:hypothetical protein
MTRVAIHQPNYAPWAGYFAKMASADVFVVLDDVQMPIGRSYVSRVQVAGRDGVLWLSVPVRRVVGETIDAVRFADEKWPNKHLATLRALYARCAYFKPVFDLIEPIYADPGERLAGFNRRLIIAIAGYLGLTPRFEASSHIGASGIGGDRLIDIVRRLGGTTYVSGKGGVSYQDPAAFEAAGIALDVREYRPVSYHRGADEFRPGLSILDALFYLGRDARSLLHYHNAAEPVSTIELPGSSLT